MQPALPREIVRAIFIENVVNGRTAYDVADQYGITHTQVRRIRNGLRCSHATVDLRQQYLKPRVANLIGEEWKQIDQADDYAVSNMGRVKRVRNGWTTTGEWLMKSRVGDRGYAYVILKQRDVEKTVKVHRLVAEAFVPTIIEKPHINHIDGDKRNNCATNLEWVTPSEKRTK